MMTSEERLSLIKTLNDFIKTAEIELEKFKKIDKQLCELLERQHSGTTALSVFNNLIKPNKEIIMSREDQISKLARQISLLNNSKVEEMKDEEFEIYINS